MTKVTADIRNNLPLMPSNARRIIEELFERKPQWTRSQLITEVQKIHAERGGIEGNLDPSNIVTKALGYLQEDGKVRNANYGYWERNPGHATEVVEHIPSAAPENTLTQAARHAEDAALAEKEIGTGAEKVYVYFNPNDRKLASFEKRTVWECKIGSTINEVDARIKAQGTRTALSREPVIGLAIRTDDCRALEKTLHNSLRLIDALVPDRGKTRVGDDWFYTSPEYVEKWFVVFQECLRQLNPHAGTP